MASPVDISVTSIGPIVEFSYELSAPGLHILRGKNGVGKTTVLRTVELATTGRTDVKPTKRDGTPGGEATIAGRTLKIARTTRQEGELTVDGLGDLDIASLHTPKFLTPEKRDQHRIVTLARLAGAQADPALFHEAVGGKEAFDAIATPETRAADDLVEMAARLKRDLHAAARAQESLEEAASATVQAQRAQFDGVDLEIESDENTLLHAHQQAVERRIALTEKRKAALATIGEAHQAQTQLDAMPAVSVDEAFVAMESSEAKVNALRAKVRDIELTLEAARREYEVACSESRAAADALASARRFAGMREKWQDQIEAGKSVQCPSDAEIAAAMDECKRLAMAVEDGRKVRAAKAAKATAEEYVRKARHYRDRAEQLREMATAVMDVLTESIARIPGCPLKVLVDDDGDARLVLATDRSEHENFDELSDGEKWKTILPIAAGKNRLIVLPQAAYGELAPSTRQVIHDVAKSIGCYVLSAQADDGELRAEMFGE